MVGIGSLARGWERRLGGVAGVCIEGFDAGTAGRDDGAAAGVDACSTAGDAGGRAGSDTVEEPESEEESFDELLIP